MEQSDVSRLIPPVSGIEVLWPALSPLCKDLIDVAVNYASDKQTENQYISSTGLLFAAVDVGLVLAGDKYLTGDYSDQLRLRSWVDAHIRASASESNALIRVAKLCAGEVDQDKRRQRYEDFIQKSFYRMRPVFSIDLHSRGSLILSDNLKRVSASLLGTVLPPIDSVDFLESILLDDHTHVHRRLQAMGISGVEVLAVLRQGNPNEPSAESPVVPVDVSEDGAINSARAMATGAGLSGRPECVANEDLLNRGALTQALGSLIRNRSSPAPFTIGLFGHWGTGKSSQIELLKKWLSQEAKNSLRIEFVEFNAWKHERVENIPAAFAQSVVDVILDGSSMFERFLIAVELARLRGKKTSEAVKKDWVAGKGWLLLVTSKLVGWVSYAILFSLIVYAFVPEELVRWSIIGVSMLSAGIFGIQQFVSINLTGWLKALNVNERIKRFQLPNYSEKIGLLADIHKTLRDLCAIHLNPGDGPKAKSETYLLIIVDDLDRCSPKTVKEVFDTVRLVAEIDRVITLIAIDERIAFSAVEKHYDQFGEFGRAPNQIARDYLAKILQVSITLPQVDEASAKQFIARNLFKEAVLRSPVPPIAKPTHQSQDRPAPENLQNPKEASISEERGNDSNEKGTATERRQPVNDLAQPLTLGSLPEERDRFESLVLAYQFMNPRLLDRLYQAWRVLKYLLYWNKDYSLDDVDRWMPLLFWREWVLQQSVELRRVSEKWFESESQGPNEHAAGAARPEELPRDLEIWLHSLLRRNQLDHINFLIETSVVDAVLLPSVSIKAKTTNGM